MNQREENNTLGRNNLDISVFLFLLGTIENINSNQQQTRLEWCRESGLRPTRVDRLLLSCHPSLAVQIRQLWSEKGACLAKKVRPNRIMRQSWESHMKAGSLSNGQMNQNYYTNAVLLLVMIILCSKIYDLTVWKLESLLNLN